MNLKRIVLIGIVIIVIAFIAGQAYTARSIDNAVAGVNPSGEINPSENASSTEDLSTLTDEEWKSRLTASQYNILREEGTEVPYTSDLLNEKRPGTYVTADCGIPVFRSETKFDSGTGWPSFYAPIEGSIVEKTDSTLGIKRTEVEEAKCNSHLGHVFNDAPQTPTGLRYCINGVALKFIPD